MARLFASEAPAQQPVDWRVRVLELRDRLLASPRFQRWATAFPLTRPIAERRARALFDLCAGFVYSQILLACVRLDLFRHLARRPRSIAELAQLTSLSPDAAARLLTAAASLKLVERRGGDRYGLGSLGAALLGNPGVAEMIEHHHLLYDDLRDPVALLRGTEPATDLGTFWAYARAAETGTLAADQVTGYSELMSQSVPLVADDVLAAYRFDRHRCLLDVGGGEGAFLVAVARQAPDLRLMLFDLPAVAERARDRLEQAGLSGRSTVSAGNFLADSLPTGADIVTLIRVVHDHDDKSVLTLLAEIHRALPPGGTLLIAEPMSGTRGAEPVGDAYFGFYLLAMGSGRARSADELGILLRRAGFNSIRVRPTRRPMLTGLVTCRKTG
jgi:demethylspheroidene O-methyltransferase